MGVSGVSERRTSDLVDDVAFGNGVEYAKWVHTDEAKKLGVDAHAEIKKAEDRQPAPQVFRRAG